MSKVILRDTREPPVIKQPDITSISLTSSAVIIVLIASFLFLSVLDGFLLDLLGTEINEWLVLALILAQSAALIMIIDRSGSVQIEQRGDDLVGFILLLIGISAYLIYPSLPTLLTPLHHHAQAFGHIFTLLTFLSCQLFCESKLIPKQQHQVNIEFARGFAFPGPKAGDCNLGLVRGRLDRFALDSLGTLTKYL